MPSNLSTLAQAILQTIAYFDTFEYPLTQVELHKWLLGYNQPLSILEIRQILRDELVGFVLEQDSGFYFLQGRKSIVQTRLLRYRLAEDKYKVALKAVGWLRFLGFVRLIAICNNVGYNNARDDSDVDFFIVAKQGRIWWVRLWVTLLVQLLGLRRHGKHEKNRICLSFYVADNQLDLSAIKLQPEDPYLIYWFATLAPIYNADMTYEHLLMANSWLQQYLPRLYPTELTDRRKINSSWASNLLKKGDELLWSGATGNIGENLAETIQRPKLDRYFGSAKNGQTTNVVMDKNMLKFHKTDRRAFYRQAWQDKLAALQY